MENGVWIGRKVKQSRKKTEKPLKSSHLTVLGLYAWKKCL